MGEIELEAAIGMLTRTTKHMARGVGGSWRFIDVPPLLLQLRLEITNTMAMAAFKGSGGPTIPIGAAAFDLLQQIEEEVSENFWNTYALHHGHGRGTLVGELLAWAMAARQDPDSLAIATRAVTGYVQQIESLIRPMRHSRTGKCPDCEHEWMQVVSDLGTTWQPVLVVTYDDDEELIGVSCLWCGKVWTFEELEELENGQETK